MGPKKGKKKDDDAADKVNNKDNEEHSLLKAEAQALSKEFNQEEKDFNEYQQQRERLNYFWIVEKKTLEDKRAQLRNKEREQQDLEEKHQVEIKIYKQRLKHLLHEHQNDITHKKTEAEMALRMAQDDDREAELEIKEDRRILSAAQREVELGHEEYVRGLKKEQDQKITMLRHEFERKANEVVKTFEQRTKKKRDDLDRARKEEIKAIEERKHHLIDQLMAEHQKAFADIKNYYNDITHNNLDLIKSLKEEVKELEAEQRKNETRLQEKRAENKRLSAPLKKMNEDVIRLKKDYEEYKKEKNEMKEVKDALLVAETEHNSLKWEYETLLQRFGDLKTERDKLKQNFMAAVFDVKQKSAFRGLLLEKKVAAMYRLQEEREAQLNEVLTRANLEPSVFGQVRGRVDDVLQKKNNEARRLQSDVSRLKALYDQLLVSVEGKMKEYGLVFTELGFVPSRMAKE